MHRQLHVYRKVVIQVSWYFSMLSNSKYRRYNLLIYNSTFELLNLCPRLFIVMFHLKEKLQDVYIWKLCKYTKWFYVIFETWIIESFYRNSLFLIMLQVTLCLSVYIQVYVLPESRRVCQVSWRLSYRQL